MSGDITIKITGETELRRNLQRLAIKSAKEAQDAIAATAIFVQTRAKQTVPVDTGRLRASIRIALNWQGEVSNISATGDRFDLSPWEPSMPASGLVAFVGSNVVYAPDVEYGTYKQHAQPYLGPAGEEGRGELKRRITIAMGKL